MDEVCFLQVWQFILKQSENELQFLDNLRPIFISFEILLKLSCDLQSLHRESTKLRKLERSSVSKLSDVSASFIAAKVVLFGFSETKASSTLSTRLLRLRLCFLASIWRRFSKFSLNRNEVCFLVTDAVFIVIPFCSAKIVHLYNISKFRLFKVEREWAVLVSFGVMPYEAFGASHALHIPLIHIPLV